MRTRVRSRLSILFAFLLTLLMIMLIVSLGLGIGAFSKGIILSSINKTDYFDKVYIDINQRTEELLTEAGLPDTLLDDIISPGRVYIEGMNYIMGKGVDISSQTESTLGEEISSRISEYIENKNLTPYSDLQEDIDIISRTIENETRSKLQLTFIEQLVILQAKHKRIVKIILPGILLLIGLLCFLIIRMYRYLYKGMRYIVYALSASSLVVLISALYILVTKVYSRLRLTPDYYSDFISEYLRNSIAVFAYIGTMGLLVVIVLISMINNMRNKIMNN